MDELLELFAHLFSCAGEVSDRNRKSMPAGRSQVGVRAWACVCAWVHARVRTCVLVVRQRACPACLPACPAVNGHVGGEGGRVGDTCLHGKSLKITQAHQVIDQRAYYHGLRACVRVHVYCACVPLGCPRAVPHVVNVLAT